MRALSFRQPWGYAVTHLGKRLENRIWRWLQHGHGKFIMNHPGPDEPFALHVSSTQPKDYDIGGVMASARLKMLPPEADLRGCIVGTARVIDVLRTDEKQTIVENTQDLPFPHYVIRPDDYARFVRKSQVVPKHQDPEHLMQLEQLRRWWMGPYAFVLTDVRVFPEPIKASGALEFWEIPDTLMDRVRHQMELSTPAPEMTARLIEIPNAAAPMVLVTDPAMPPDAFEMRSAAETVRVEDVGPMPTQQLDMFGGAQPSPKKSGLH